MLSVIEIIFIILGLGLLWLLIKFNTRKESARPSSDLILLPYEKAPTVLNDTEQKFYHALKDVIGDQYTVFAKVRFSDFIDVKKGMDKDDTSAFKAKLDAHSIDFLLCSPRNTDVVLAIELEDILSPHADRAQQEVFVDKVFKDSKAQLLRFKVRGSYSSDILTQLKQHIRFEEETDTQES